MWDNNFKQLSSFLLSLYLASSLGYLFFESWVVFDITKWAFLRIFLTLLSFLLIPIVFAYLEPKIREEVENMNWWKLFANIVVVLIIICFTLSLIILWNIR